MPDAGGARGCCPRSNVSMTIIGAPHDGQTYGVLEVSAVASGAESLGALIALCSEELACAPDVLVADGLSSAWTADAVVLPPEGDAALVAGDQPAVGDAHAMREISQYRFGSGKGARGVDRPLDAANRP